MERIEIQLDEKKIQIDYNEDTGKVIYVDYLDHGYPVEVSKC